MTSPSSSVPDPFRVRVFTETSSTMSSPAFAIGGFPGGAGGGLFGVVTVIVTSAVPVSVWFELAFTLMLCVPAEALLHMKLYGAVASSPILVAPSKNSAFRTVPVGVDAVAEIVMEVPEMCVDPLEGLVIVTRGATGAVLTTTFTPVDDVIKF